MPPILLWIGLFSAIAWALDQADDAADSGARLVQWLVIAGVLYGGYQVLRR